MYSTRVSHTLQSLSTSPAVTCSCIHSRILSAHCVLGIVLGAGPIVLGGKVWFLPSQIIRSSLLSFFSLLSRFHSLHVGAFDLPTFH